MSDWFDNLPNHPKYYDEVEIENPCLTCGKESIEEYDNYYCSDNCLEEEEKKCEHIKCSMDNKGFDVCDACGKTMY